MPYRKTLRIASVGNVCFLLIVYCCHAQPISAQKPQGDAYFTLQVAVLSFNDTANAYVADLREKGYPAYISELTTQRGKVLYRIRIGRFTTDAEARRYSTEFTAQGNIPPIIVKSSKQSIHTETAQHTEQKLKNAAAPAALTRDNQTSSIPADTPPDSSASRAALLTIDNQTVAYYTVQLSAVTDKSAAERYVASLMAKGFPAFTSFEKKEGGASLYRIRIGKYETQAAAKNMALNIQTREKIPCIIVRALDTVSVSSNKKPLAMPSDNGILEDDIDDPRLEEQSVMLPETVTQESLEIVQQQQVIPPAAPHQTAPSREQDPSDTTIKVFTYRQANGTLSLTNNYYSIPDELRKNIEYISLYPVRFVSLDSTGTHIICNIDGTAKPVVLAGVSLPSHKFSQRVVDYFTKHLNNASLRLRYNPSITNTDGIIIGMLYLREGTYINPDLVRQGIASLCHDTLPTDQKALFKMAETKARHDQKGIWTAP